MIDKAPFQKNDIVELTVRMKIGVRVERAVVTSDPVRFEDHDGNKRSGWSFTYKSENPAATGWWGWGCSVLRDITPAYGLVTVTVVGRCESKATTNYTPGYSIFRHPSYDLMHNPKKDLP